MDLTFQVPMQYFFFFFSQYQTLLSPPDTSTAEHCFCFGPGASFFLELLVIALYPSPVAYWTSSSLRGSSTSIISFHISILFMKEQYSCRGSNIKNAGVGCHSFLQWILVCQKSLLWPVHLEWPCIAWLTAPLSYASPFTLTRLWFMKGNEL